MTMMMMMKKKTVILLTGSGGEWRTVLSGDLPSTSDVYWSDDSGVFRAVVLQLPVRSHRIYSCRSV